MRFYLNTSDIQNTDAKSSPEISLPASSLGGSTYVVVCFDLDPPFPSWNTLGPGLHWLQSGLKVGPGQMLEVAGKTPVIAFYAGPAPPPGSGPHRYLFIVYEQPEGFDVKKWARKEGKRFSI
jgi:phosphatidylethanolamine-binding protein (PEBP) family uncharacterized protein